MPDIPNLKPSVNAWAPEFLDEQYARWKSDRSAVDPSWQQFFEGFDLGLARDGAAATVTPAGSVTTASPTLVSIYSLVYHYRDVGHLIADVDPLGKKRPRPTYLELESFGLTEKDFDLETHTNVFGVPNPVKLRDLITHLEATYCGHLGAEYMHIQETAQRRWLQEKLETNRAQPNVSADVKKAILRHLLSAEEFEQYLHETYKGEKRFSLEGAETLIPMLKVVMDSAVENGVEEMVYGMAHRGRMNVLANILQKGYQTIFAEFEGNYEETADAGGDVKYHKGFSSVVQTTSGRSLNLRLVANPSHLEAVDPVVLGRVRARQTAIGDTARKRVMPVLIHGDAAFCGQGIVAEILQMAYLPGYTTGGTLHVVINNQIGFTTDPSSARSSTYCTDFAKIIQAPIFHVNGDDPEMCAFVASLAVEYRQRFGKDVVIDMWCYRKYGHNEGDEPAYTQPVMYEQIRKRKSIVELYGEKLANEGISSAAEFKGMETELHGVFDDAHSVARELRVKRNQEAFKQSWVGYRSAFSFNTVDTTFSVAGLQDLARKLSVAPDEFNVNAKVRRLYLENRREAVLENKSMDWGTVEILAYGSLLSEGIPVRLTGQDVRRGTFTHRHAVIVDAKTEAAYVPLNNIGATATFQVFDSPLAEASVVGFEYGYSLDNPKCLVIWEAQFGDFANGAQVLIDQFISCAEFKWDRSSGLILLLPHGYEHQGPEHSSARLERFLQLCAGNNMIVCNFTTPAQYFHAVRRQMKTDFRKPLIVMTPKSLLRHEKAVSTLDDLTKGGFQEIIDDAEAVAPAKVSRVILCTGKVYYDLINRRAQVESHDTAIIRIEQLYPLHAEKLKAALANYPSATEFVWCQEEPRNMGAWTFISDAVEENLGIRLKYVGRPAAAAPAVGSKKASEKEQVVYLEAAIPATTRAPKLAAAK